MTKRKVGKLIASRYRVIERVKLGFGKEKKYICLDIKTNKRVFIKTGNEFKSLESEFNIQNCFYRQFKLTNGKVTTPKPIKIIIAGNETILVSEYLILKNIINLNNSSKARIYVEVLTALQRIKAEKSLLDERSIKTRKPLYLLASVPYYVIKDLLAGMKNVLLFKSLVFMISAIPSLIRLKNDSLCHGDINTTNMFLSGRKIVLLDFGESVISNRFFDASKAINSTWFRPNFSETLQKMLYSEKLLKKQNLKTFAALSIYNLMQRMSVELRSEKKQFYENQLNKFLAI
jgi:thiamine kinase-like enzyme